VVLEQLLEQVQVLEQVLEQVSLLAFGSGFLAFFGSGDLGGKSLFLDESGFLLAS
jgi:hypothetical protein